MNNLGNITIAEKVALRDIAYYYAGCNCSSRPIKNHYINATILYNMGKEIRMQNRILNDSIRKVHFKKRKKLIKYNKDK